MSDDEYGGGGGGDYDYGGPRYAPQVCFVPTSLKSTAALQRMLLFVPRVCFLCVHHN